MATRREWLRKGRNACKGAACLERAYLQRIAELDPLGRAKNRRVELVKTN